MLSNTGGNELSIITVRTRNMINDGLVPPQELTPPSVVIEK